MSQDLLKPRRGRAPLSLLPFRPLAAIAAAMEEGLHNYARYNWTAHTDDWREVYTDALLRHAHKYADPTEPDTDDGDPGSPGSGLNHLCHVGACVLILLWKAGVGYQEPNAAKRSRGEEPT